MKVIRSAIVAAVVAGLSGCGGGGAGAGPAGPVDPIGGGGFAIDREAIEFVYVQSGGTPAAQVVHATWTDADAYFLALGYRSGGSRPEWLPPVSIEAAPGGGAQIAFTVDATGLAPGRYTTSPAMAIERADGSVIGYRILKITLVVHAPPAPTPSGTRLVVDAEGVALTSTPGLSRLSRTLSVGTNRGGAAVAWTAGSSAPWLHVTPGGAAGDPLVVAADPAGLATDAVHEAVVTVTSGDPALSVTTEVVRVGLWVGALTPEPLSTVAVEYRDLAVDPVRPHVYLVNGSRLILVHNVHTGERVGSIDVSRGVTLRSPTVSADGTRLYVVDAFDGRVTAVDLATRTVRTTWKAGDGARIAWTRVNGIPALVSTSGQAFDPETGAVLGAVKLGASADALLDVSRDGRRLCTADRHVRDGATRCVALDAGAGPAGPAVLFGPVRSRPSSVWAPADLRLAPDGTRAYLVAGGLELSVVDAADPALAILGPFSGGGTGLLDAIALDVDGRVHAGGRPVTGAATLWSWDGAGTLRGSREAGHIIPGRLAVTGDGLRAVAVTEASERDPTTFVELVTLP